MKIFWIVSVLAVLSTAGAALPVVAAGPHIIVVTVKHNGTVVEAGVTAVDKGENPPEHYAGTTQKGVYRFPVEADAKGPICFTARTKFAPILKSEEHCVKAPYPAALTVNVK